MMKMVGLVLAVALLATAAVVVISARDEGSSDEDSQAATTWNPDDGPVLGDATKPAMSYESVRVRCAKGELTASPHEGGDKIASAVVDSFKRCSFAGQDATVDCGDGRSSRLRLIARTDDSPGGTGDVALNAGFACEVTVEGVCTISLAGPQRASGFTLNEAKDVLSLDASFEARRSGSSLCGPQEGSMVWQARFKSWSLTIDS